MNRSTVSDRIRKALKKDSDQDSDQGYILSLLFALPGVRWVVRVEMLTSCSGSKVSV